MSASASFAVTQAGRVALAQVPAEHFPGPRAMHAINNAAQIVAFIATSAAHYSAERLGSDAQHVAALLIGAARDIAELQVLLARQERVIEEQRVECLREKQYSTRVEEKNSELTQSVINLTRQLETLGVDTSTLPRTAVGATA